jgi:uncharacterized membrane protein
MRTKSTPFKLFSLLTILSLLLGLLPAAQPGRAASPAAPQPPDLTAGLPTQPLNELAVHEPAVLSQPLSISRVQSSYSEPITVITLTVSNLLPFTLVPAVDESAPITDTVALLADFDPTADANTLRTVSVSDVLQPGVTLLGASNSPQVSGSTITWSLADLAPQASAVLTMALQSPGAGADFLNLDDGAQATAERWGESVAASARPVTLAPSGVSPATTRATPDADLYDSEMLWKAGMLDQDPLVMFAYVRGFRYDPYTGSLRGTRGTLWGEASNSLDRASLLIAMLRAAGVPARYRHGTLSVARAQELLSGAFPAATGLAGWLPAGTPVADPLNDSALIALARDHWWTQAYLPGVGWTDLDPSFPQAEPGDIFVESFASDGTDLSAEIPASQRHTITARLVVEQYSAFPVGGSNLSTFTPLETTYPTARLAGKRMTFAHLQTTEIQGGIYSNVIYTYTPYFGIEDNGTGIMGDPFQDLLTNFPLATVFTTAEWLEYEISDPQGNVETFRRTVKDRIGEATRLSGDPLNLQISSGSPPFTSFDDLYVNWVLPNDVLDWVYQRQIGDLLRHTGELAAHSQAMLELVQDFPSDGELSPEQLDAFGAARSALLFANERMLTGAGLEFAFLADQAAAQIEHGLRVKLFFATPRVFTAASIGDPAGLQTEALTTTIDLRRTTSEAIVYPGQAQAALFSANWIKGVVESALEGQALQVADGGTPLTTLRIFEEMFAQGIQPVLVKPETADLLDAYPISAPARAWVVQALAQGRWVLIPGQSVLVDGEPTFAWWEFDPQTGETVSVGENGLRPSSLEYRYLQIIVEEFVDDIAGAGNGGFSPPDINEVADAALKIGLKLRGYFLAAAAGLQGGAQANNMTAAITGAIGQAADWRYLPAYLCPTDNCGIEQFVLPGINPSPIPLPEVLFRYADDPAALPGDEAIAIRVVSVEGNQPPGTPTFNLGTAPASSSTTPGSPAGFQAQISSNFDDDFTLSVYAPPGWSATLDTDGNVTVTPPGSTTADEYTIQAVAQSTIYPELVEIAQHIVTVTTAENATLDIQPEARISVPMGAAQIEAVSNQTNDGEAEVEGAAYSISLHNNAGEEHTYNLSVSGLPGDWIVLNGVQGASTQVTLAAGGMARIGLYINPPAGTLPAPGTAYSINVNATSLDNPGLSASDSDSFNMPDRAFNYVTLEPDQFYLAVNSSADFTLQITNVGNTAGEFTLAASTPLTGGLVSGLVTPLTLGIGETQIQNATLQVGATPAGLRVPLIIASQAPGSYTQYAVGNVIVVTESTANIFRAAGSAARACTLGEPGLSAALEGLGLRAIDLENSCAGGNCSLGLRDQVVTSIQSAARYAAFAPQMSADDAFLSIAASLSGHISAADILQDLANLNAAAATLELEACELSQHLPDVRWTPGYTAALLGQPASFTLDVTNLGSLQTTYAITVELPGGPQFFDLTLDPGETSSADYPVSSATLGLVDLAATARATGSEVLLPSLSTRATARLNVVDRFLQLTAVTLDPPFVETGASSTTLRFEVNNVANLPWQATARASFLAPGGAQQYTFDTPITVLAGAPRTYELGIVDTSGWTAGIYTATVELLDASLVLIPDGSGYGYLGVGQALGAQHSLTPSIAAPGTVTVTTQITTVILEESIVPGLGVNAQPFGWNPTGLRVADNGSLSTDSGNGSNGSGAEEERGIDTTWAITRTENSDPGIVYSGTWTLETNPVYSRRASNSDYTSSGTTGDSASFIFNGTWVHLGFATDRFGGFAEIFIDGISQGTVDLYTTDLDVTSRSISGLADTSHTLSIVVIGSSHPNSSGIQVRLDYIDTWDSTLMPDGLYEQDSPRVWRSDDWSDIAEPAASGGSYMSDGLGNDSTAWFPFTGDSISFIGLANNQAASLELAVDGEILGKFNLFNAIPITRTYSFEGFGPGPHVLQVRHFNDKPNVDAFLVPGAPPFYQEPTFSGIVRYEEDHPAILYNGESFRQRPQSWDLIASSQASEYNNVGSQVLSDTIQMTFDGQWVSIGLRTRNRGGQGEVFIDGTSVGIIDAYSDGENVRSYQFGDLAPGTHTLEIVVLDVPNPIYNYVYLDYIDVWDGQSMPDDLVNARRAETNGRIHVSDSVVDVNDPNAYQGDYVAASLLNSNANVWYNFTGDSFTYLAFSRANGGSVEVYVDGVLIDTVDITYPFTQQPLAFHYTGFEDGPHTVLIHNILYLRVDAFASNPTSLTPYQPIVEWYDDTPAGNGAPFFGTYGIAAGMAAGDLDGDGSVEIVVTADDVQNFGTMFVYRGDGGDTGDGDPILWSVDYGGGTFRTWVSTPALAELDGQPGAEVIVAAGDQLYAYHADGSSYWVTDTVQIFETLTAPAVGNIDDDPEPEIVINAGDFLEIRRADGSLEWVSPSFGAEVNPPILADLTGDGRLDILVTEWGDTATLFDYNFGAPQVAWSVTLPSSMSGTFGAPAVADIDGQQPGGDPGPEVAIASNGWLTVLNGENGSIVWSTPLDSGNPGGVSIADLDGDGEIEIVTGMRYEFEPGRFGKIYALNADGSLLWSAIAEDSTSANNAAVMDLNGDGLYEVAWNGKEQGFTVFNGLDGAVLFNEPLVNSFTGTDYPIFADVDNDNHAEVVVAALRGVRVFGFGTGWGDARPLWNQHSYHITNINDNLGTPESELNSWEIHNTYRTQTPLRSPLPVYPIVLTHTVGEEGVSVLTGTFSTPPTSANDPQYTWSYQQDWAQLIVTYTFDSRLENLQPGETRLAAQGTQVQYTLPSGTNNITLPPLYVSAPHIIAIDPPLRQVPAGATGAFTVTLSNPGDASQLCTLSLGGLPEGWYTLPTSVEVPPGSQVEAILSVSIPQGAEATGLPFNIALKTSLGGQDQASADLEVTGPALLVDIQPEAQSVRTGETVTYTLVVTNLESVDRTYTLSPNGSVPLGLPGSVNVAAGSSLALDFNAQAPAAGPNPFSIVASIAEDGASVEDSAVLVGEGSQVLQVNLAPEGQSGGPGMQSIFSVTVTNLGDSFETVNLDLSLPPGWFGELTLFGQPVSTLELPPATFNRVELQLALTPPPGTPAGDYDFSVSAQAQQAPNATASDTGVLSVGTRGVTIEIVSGPGELIPGQTGVWELEVTNSGSQADTFALSAFGIIAETAQFSPAAVTLGPGESQTVILSSSGMDYALPQNYWIGALAESQSQPDVRDEDATLLRFAGLTAIQVTWEPVEQAINGINTAAFRLQLSNPGSLGATFQLSFTAHPQAEMQAEVFEIYIPAQMSLAQLVRVTVNGSGFYQLHATAASGNLQDSATALLTVSGLQSSFYLPLVQR